MKKSLIALAVLAVSGAAMAQSSVTLSGFIKTGISQTKLSHGAGDNGSATAVLDGASRFILSGKEDLGGGMNAVFAIETRFRPDESPAAVQAAGETFVGLAGSWGQARIGKFNTHYCYGFDKYSSGALALQHSSCALMSYVNANGYDKDLGNASRIIANSGRSMNMMRYDLPNIGGLTGNFSYSTGWRNTGEGVGDAGKGYAMAGQLTYTAGPLEVGGSAWKGTTENQASGADRADQEAYTVAGAFDLKFAKFGLTYDESEVTLGKFGGVSSDVKRAAWSVPVSVPLGNGKFMFTYTQADNTKTNGVKNADTGAYMWSAGYDYSLSKRTSIGLSYAEINNKANANYDFYTQARLGATKALENMNPGQDRRQLYLGVKHSF